MAAVYGIILLGSLFRILPVTVLNALFTLPMAIRETRLISGNLGNPYGLMPAMLSNIKIYVYTALLILAGCLISFLVKL
jgi:1,4-dihydroxy-2-naphthoate octaprenyltransferase